MTNYSWSQSNGGDWSDVSNWTPNGVPGPIDLAMVTLAGSYTIMLDVGEIGSLTLNAEGVTIQPTGTVKLDGTLDVKAGTLVVSQTIQGGTLIADGGSIDYDFGTLDGVILAGPLDLSGYNQTVTIKDGITFTGSGREQIIVDGGTTYAPGNQLIFDGNQTLDNVAITLGGAYEEAFIQGPFTLGADSTLTTVGYAYVSDLVNEGSITAAKGTFDANAIDNRGSIDISCDEGAFHSIASLTNSGTVSLSSGANVETSEEFTNLGNVVLSGDGTNLSVYGTFDNTTGSITVGSGSTLDENGSLTFAQLGAITHDVGGLVFSGISLDLTGQIADITEASTLDGAVLSYSNIDGGIIKPDGGEIDYKNVGLHGVTFDGALDLTQSEEAVTVYGGLNFIGPGPAQINVDDQSALYLNGTSTLGDVSVTLGAFGTGAIGGDDLTLGRQGILYFGDGGGTITGGTFDNQGTVAADGSLQGYAAITNDGSFNLDGVGPNSFSEPFANSGTLTVSGEGTDFEPISGLSNTGTIVIGSSLVNPSGVLSSTAGTFELAGGSLNLTGNNNTINDLTTSGTVSLSGSQTSLLLAGAFSNTGIVTLSDGATLADSAQPGSVGTVSFSGDSTIVLGDAQDAIGLAGGYGGTIGDFTSGDRLELSGSGYSLDHLGDTLTVSQGGAVVDTFALTGQDYTDATFTLTGDIITTDAPCFCAGTRILTDQGERAVETMAAGDVVVTRQDGVEVLLPVRWIGRRRVVVARHNEAEHVDPIRIAQDAIAPGLPVRDLFVSPDHALYMDGMLIQARQLVNHMTVTRDSGRAVVTYYHVELDRHAILIADGMPCESYLDSGNRGQFDAVGSVVSLHGATINRVLRACAPIVTSADLVRPIWQRLADRALAAGHVVPVPNLEPDLLPWFETADGERLMPHGDRLRVALPLGCRRVRLRSRSDVPTTLSPWSDDRRRLGVAIGAVTLCQGNWRQQMALADLGVGWWPLETAGDLAWRWTNGDGWIDLPEPASEIEITLHATMLVPVNRPAPARLAPVYAQAG